MKTKRLLALLCLALPWCYFIDASAICGDPTSSNDIEVATVEIINRLMGSRKPDWGWAEIDSAVVVALQVATPKMFFGREKTARTLEIDIRDTFYQMNLWQKSEHALAAQALCLNPYNVSGVNMIQDIREEVLRQYPHENDNTPAIGFFMFSTAIAALCTNNDEIGEWIVKKTLSGQNEDGSFGNSNQFLATIVMLQSLHCVAQVPSPTFNSGEVRKSVRKMHRFIIGELENPQVQERIMATPGIASITLGSLWETKEPMENPNNKWNCSDITNVLGIFPLPGESEFNLIARLMRLHGASFMDVGYDGYGCIEPDPIPENYSPTCNHDIPGTCQPKKN